MSKSLLFISLLYYSLMFCLSLFVRAETFYPVLSLTIFSISFLFLTSKVVWFNLRREDHNVLYFIGCYDSIDINLYKKISNLLSIEFILSAILANLFIYKGNQYIPAILVIVIAILRFIFYAGWEISAIRGEKGRITFFKEQSKNNVEYKMQSYRNDEYPPHYILSCKCKSPVHMAVLEAWIWGEGDGELSIGMQDYYPENLWGRLKWIWNIVLKRKGLTWGECAVRENQLPELIDYLNKVNKYFIEENDKEKKELTKERLEELFKNKTTDNK